MLWLLVLFIVVVVTLPFSDNSSSEDINFYKNGMLIYHKNSENNDKYTEW